ncbi:MAG: RNA polymerase sigma-70 factor [Bacteroidota bacterium]
MLESDQILVQKLRRKDISAFELVFNDYYGLLKSYAQRFLDDEADAEEVVQETFIKFWEKCESLDPLSSIKNYLYRSVHNSCLNFIKHQKVKDTYKQYIIEFMEEGEESVYNEEGEKSTIEKIIAEIDKLPPKCQEIFKLSRFEGLKYQEIASHLNISIKTVEVQMGKALRVLREKFKDHTD